MTYGTGSLPASRSRSTSRSPSRMTAEEYEPARPRSAVTSSTAARRTCSRSVVSGWSTSEKLDSAETARVMARAYGAASLLRCWALTMREAAMSSIARVIFLVEVTERMRCR